MENASLLSALAKAQLEIKPPVKDKVNPQFKSKYASIDSIYHACREVLAKYGLTLTHTVLMRDGKYFLETVLNHVGGGYLKNEMPIFVVETTPQKFASALTYARRYATSCLLAIPADDDDDGEEAEKEAKKDDEKEKIKQEFWKIVPKEISFVKVHEFLDLMVKKWKCSLDEVMKSALKDKDAFLKDLKKHLEEKVQ